MKQAMRTFEENPEFFIRRACATDGNPADRIYLSTLVSMVPWDARYRTERLTGHFISMILDGWTFPIVAPVPEEEVVRWNPMRHWEQPTAGIVNCLAATLQAADDGTPGPEDEGIVQKVTAKHRMILDVIARDTAKLLPVGQNHDLRRIHVVKGLALLASACNLGG